MAISKTIETLINKQINEEIYSAHLYLGMASYFLHEELNGFGNFFVVQSHEENNHAMKYFQYLHEVGGKLKMEALPAPNQSYSSAVEVFEQALAHEEKVTQSTYDLIDHALKEKDFATYTFLEWFVKEQVEEEALMRSIVARLQMIKNDMTALFFLNEELSKRKLEPIKDSE